MMISTRGRYALRVMLDLAKQKKGEYVAMKSVADRQGISLKYLEKILPVLVGAGFVEGVQGKGGGYRLTGDPSAYSVGEILRLTEGDLAPVACLGCEAKPCERSVECETRPLWIGLYKTVTDYLNGVSLADLMPKSEDFSI